MDPLQHPEALLEKIVNEEQTKMKVHLGFFEEFIPSVESEAKCNIFLSPNWNSCRRLLLIIVGGKGIQPGIWSRSLVLESHSTQSAQGFRNGSM